MSQYVRVNVQVVISESTVTNGAVQIHVNTVHA